MHACRKSKMLHSRNVASKQTVSLCFYLLILLLHAKACGHHAWLKAAECIIQSQLVFTIIEGEIYTQMQLLYTVQCGLCWGATSRTHKTRNQNKGKCAWVLKQHGCASCVALLVVVVVVVMVMVSEKLYAHTQTRQHGANTSHLVGRNRQAARPSRRSSQSKSAATKWRGF